MTARPRRRSSKTHIPAAGDLDGDGAPELVAVLQGGGLVALRNDGSEYWRVDAGAIPNAARSVQNGSVSIHDLEGRWRSQR